VADSVNPIAITRRAWRDVATHAGTPFAEIEVICSDEIEHRRRVESRAGDIAGLPLPAWDDVQSRQRDPWETIRIVIDTAGQAEAESFVALKRALNAAS
jgi:hypothetical protein